MTKPELLAAICAAYTELLALTRATQADQHLPLRARLPDLVPLLEERLEFFSCPLMPLARVDLLEDALAKAREELSEARAVAALLEQWRRRDDVLTN